MGFDASAASNLENRQDEQTRFTDASSFGPLDRGGMTTFCLETLGIPDSTSTGPEAVLLRDKRAEYIGLRAATENDSLIEAFSKGPKKIDLPDANALVRFLGISGSPIEIVARASLDNRVTADAVHDGLSIAFATWEAYHRSLAENMSLHSDDRNNHKALLDGLLERHEKFNTAAQPSLPRPSNAQSQA